MELPIHETNGDISSVVAEAEQGLSMLLYDVELRLLSFGSQKRLCWQMILN